MCLHLSSLDAMNWSFFFKPILLSSKQHYVSGGSNYVGHYLPYYFLLGDQQTKQRNDKRYYLAISECKIHLGFKDCRLNNWA